MERPTQLSWTELLPGPESTAVRASISETSQTAIFAQTAPEIVASKAGAAFLDPEQVPQGLAALPQAAIVATSHAALFETAPVGGQGVRLALRQCTWGIWGNISGKRHANRPLSCPPWCVVFAQMARFADTAALFQALGGGWRNRADVEPPKQRPFFHPLNE
jgi:hypothetical protein